jgi:site-specific DNA-methyltransferase (adenine-specific)
MRLLLGDCLDRMAEVEDGSVDLILADLPYGTTACKWDTVIPLGPLWHHYRRVLKPRGAVVLTASQPFTTDLIASNREWFKYCWVWVKRRATGFMHAKNSPLKRHEDVIVFSPGVVNHASMTRRRMAYNPQFRPGKPYTKVDRTPNVRGTGSHHASKCNLEHVGKVRVCDGSRYPSSVLEFSEHNAGNVHQTRKPLPLFEYLVRTYSNPGDLVMDNAMGSGTTGEACLNTGRDFIGMERDPRYFSLAKRRIASAALQMARDRTGAA